MEVERCFLYEEAKKVDRSFQHGCKLQKVTYGLREEYWAIVDAAGNMQNNRIL